MFKNVQNILPVIVLAFFIAACNPVVKQQEIEFFDVPETKETLYADRVKELFSDLFVLIGNDFHGSFIQQDNLKNKLEELVCACIKSDRKELSFMGKLIGGAKERKKYPFVFYVKKIDMARKKLKIMLKRLRKRTKEDLSDVCVYVEKVRAELKRTKSIIANHPRYEKENDRYELVQMVKGNGLGFIKPVISVMTKVF